MPSKVLREHGGPTVFSVLLAKEETFTAVVYNNVEIECEIVCCSLLLCIYSKIIPMSCSSVVF